MRTSRRGIELIAEFEGVHLKPYNDPVGHCTVGVGHLIHRGPCTDEDRRRWRLKDREAAFRLLADDLPTYEQPVNRLGVALSQSQFDALVSFTYNVGPGWTRGSTILARLRAGNYAGAADALLAWNKAGGRVLPGLTRRRKAERNLFLSGSPPVQPPARDDWADLFVPVLASC